MAFAVDLSDEGRTTGASGHRRDTGRYVAGDDEQLRSIRRQIRKTPPRPPLEGALGDGAQGPTVVVVAVAVAVVATAATAAARIQAPTDEMLLAALDMVAYFASLSPRKHRPPTITGALGAVEARGNPSSFSSLASSSLSLRSSGGKASAPRDEASAAEREGGHETPEGSEGSEGSKARGSELHNASSPLWHGSGGQRTTGGVGVRLESFTPIGRICSDYCTQRFATSGSRRRRCDRCWWRQAAAASGGGGGGSIEKAAPSRNRLLLCAALRAYNCS